VKSARRFLLLRRAEAIDLMFSAGSSASVYGSAGLGRCLRDIRTAGQHITVVPFNYAMAGQAFNMETTPLLMMDDRGADRLTTQSGN
jgi:hypothetical protein